MSSKSSPCAAKTESSAAASSGERPKYLGRELHASSFGISATRSTQDRAHGALVKVRSLCCKCATAGLRHDEIADAIGVPARTLSSYKSGVTVPHVVVEALESLVLRVERKVGGPA